MITKNTLLPKGLFVFVTILLCFSFGCSETGTSEPETNEIDRYWEKVKELYQKAKESGEKVPENMTDWVTEDIKKIGTWEYKIVYLDVEGESTWVDELNKMGNDRWECFWVEKKNKRLLLFFKRPRKSYLKAIPMREILKSIPQSESQ